MVWGRVLQACPASCPVHLRASEALPSHPSLASSPGPITEPFLA